MDALQNSTRLMELIKMWIFFLYIKFVSSVDLFMKPTYAISYASSALHQSFVLTEKSTSITLRGRLPRAQFHGEQLKEGQIIALMRNLILLICSQTPPMNFCKGFCTSASRAKRERAKH